jgi:hypothetical protein
MCKCQQSRTDSVCSCKPKIEMGKSYTQRGVPARILCVDADGQPVIALIDGVVQRFNANGQYHFHLPSKDDLVEVKPKAVVHLALWLDRRNPRNCGGTAYPNEQLAKARVADTGSSAYYWWYETVEKDVE